MHERSKYGKLIWNELLHVPIMPRFYDGSISIKDSIHSHFYFIWWHLRNQKVLPPYLPFDMIYQTLNNTVFEDFLPFYSFRLIMVSIFYQQWLPASESNGYKLCRSVWTTIKHPKRPHRHHQGEKILFPPPVNPPMPGARRGKPIPKKLRVTQKCRQVVPKKATWSRGG